MSTLNVELYGELLGYLKPKGTSFVFETNTAIFERYPIASPLLSLAAPLLPQLTPLQQKRAMNFFSELLPEGRNLTWLMQSLPPAEQNTYGLLRKYGKDSAGALIIYDPHDPAAAKKPKREKVDAGKIRYLLENMPQAPLANSPLSGKTSLGGVQGKIVLARKDDSWYRTHYGSPSTHILKPVVADYPTMIYDEAFGMQFAQKAGLTDHSVWIENFDGADALIIERYDRSADLADGRIHQEDFNQALGAHGDQKYQEIGGKVSAERIAMMLERFGHLEDVKAFASQLLFALAIGNLDMHAKNISIFHYPDASICLTPTYDQVPLWHQPTDGRVALAINGEHWFPSINHSHIEKELLSWKSQAFPDKTTVDEFIEHRFDAWRSILDQVPLHDKAYPRLREDIAGHLARFLSKK